MLDASPALRREQIKLQVALVNALMYVKGYAAPETRASRCVLKVARTCSA